MEEPFRYIPIPTSRIATFDVNAIGQGRHHVSALLEFDVTDSRIKLKEINKAGKRVSFTAWLVSVIGQTLSHHPDAASFLYSKRRLITFRDINITIVVEKAVAGKKVPIPLLIERTHEKSAEEITAEIERAKGEPFSPEGVVLHRRAFSYERFYYRLPGMLRRAIWRFLLRHPKIAYKKMGNALVTSIGMMGAINGWFVHSSLHPISFGVGAIIKKPVVVEDDIQIREILNVTILFDHNVIDGAPMVRFVNELSEAIRTGDGL